MQARGCFCFREESRQFIRAVMAGEHLRRDEAIQFFLASAKNDAHPAAAQFAFDLVIAENRATHARNRLRNGIGRAWIIRRHEETIMIVSARRLKRCYRITSR
jgi:hypothetical protein